ncbi:MAG: Uma2 family endonuclease [Planctomycetota bacterium]|jgi:Uma2 family endonuclease|nr:Uma2 family endonuclease [Planctomycetota bacterium]
MNSPIKPQLNRLHKYTYREYQHYPNDGFRHEIIDGDHFMSPAPSTKHQRVSSNLHFQLYSQINLTKRGAVFSAPTDVELADHDIVQPDLVVVMDDQKEIITSKRILGVPRLVIEILSPSNPDHDRVLKFEMFARTGVSEYWIIDAESEILEQWVLDDGNYRSLGQHHDSFQAHCLKDVTIQLEAIWD